MELFADPLISGERLGKKMMLLIQRGIKPKFIDLGYSWLAPVEAYVSDMVLE
jgi:hypothetical protein